MALPIGRPWQTPSGCLVRCDEIRIGRGAPVEVSGLTDEDLAQHDAWAQITIVEPPPEHSVWLHVGSELAIDGEIWRVELIADGPPRPLVGGSSVVRPAGQVVTLTRES